MTTSPSTATATRAEPVVIVSSDCHIGPRLVEDLRPYCPAELRSRFDAYVADTGRSKGRCLERDKAAEPAGDPQDRWRNHRIAGHHDPEARRADLDFDGMTGEVIFHGSQNDQPIPFQTSMIGAPDDPSWGRPAFTSTTGGWPTRAPGRPIATWACPTCPCGDMDAARDELAVGGRRRAQGDQLPGPAPLAPSLPGPLVGAPLGAGRGAPPAPHHPFRGRGTPPSSSSTGPRGWPS